MAKIIIKSPLNGEVVSVQEVQDQTFMQEILGVGVAIKPLDGKIYSPVDGKIGSLFETLYAFTIKSNDGVEILVHLGIDTVKLNGEGFISHTKSGAEVKQGDLLIEFDKDLIESKGYDSICPVIILNNENYTLFEPNFENVKVGDPIIELS